MSLRERKEVSENCTLYFVLEGVIELAEKEFSGSGERRRLIAIERLTRKSVAL
jgi:hypothetical protein